jgi:acetolactate synthase-1/2/3 large subunit
MLTRQTAAKLLVNCLVKQGVEYIFGIPGAKIDAVFDALLDSPIKLIVCRHEQNAAFMAAAYGRLTGKPGIVLVTSGPGVSNLATGLLTANTEGDPVIALGGAVPLAVKLKECHQNTDNIKLMEAVTKARMEAVSAEAIPEIIDNAFRIATAPRSGAVFISLPQDVLNQYTDTQACQPVAAIQQGPAPDTILAQAAKIINEAKCPVLLLGLEASRPHNTIAIRQLLSQYAFPVAGTYQAAGVISRELVNHFVGRVGLFKNQPADKLLDMADVIVTIGYNPVEYDPELWNTTGKKKIIHLDYQACNLRACYLPALEVVGNIALNVEKLSPLLHPRQKFDFSDEIKTLQTLLQNKIESGAQRKGRLMHPLRFIHDLRNTIDDTAIIISDIGSHYMWLARYFFSYQPHHLLFSNGQQTLGVALPWAIAAHLAEPNKKIVSISGDGGFLFSAAELETAVREKIPLVHCVWCDGAYDMVLEQEKMKYHRESGVRLGYVDIVKFAESFGAQGFRVNEPAEFVPILQKALQLDSPVLIEIPIDYADNRELFAASHESMQN